ncbi:MAG: BrnT family toxin [Sterolibacterium sp.]
MDFEFDPAKNIANIKKHGVDLADVEGVFYDQSAVTVEDNDHDEQRFVTIGMDDFGRILVVCYTYRGKAAIRLISARKAKPHEHKVYEG